MNGEGGTDGKIGGTVEEETVGIEGLHVLVVVRVRSGKERMRGKEKAVQES